MGEYDIRDLFIYYLWCIMDKLAGIWICKDTSIQKPLRYHCDYNYKLPYDNWNNKIFFILIINYTYYEYSYIIQRLILPRLFGG